MSTEYIIKADGAILRRDIEERELQPPISLAEALVDKITLPLRNAVTVNKLPCGIMATKNSLLYVSVPLPSIFIRAPYKLVEGLLVPNFTSQDDPIMTMEWPRPKDMNLVLLIECSFMGVQCCANTAWLFAQDTRKNIYRLPLGNVFEDCKLCLGDNNYGRGRSLVEAAEALVETFHRSQYNADLWKTVAETQSLFRFKPENSHFIPVPPTAPWAGLCQKVAVAISANIVL